ncbi:hypothetical protein [Algoriphagus sp. A40]|uniref:hypothetical protein n=1 Tax=Algoriphagus sp. A40 TaxID=1945863 RepID=UPI000986C745|nr:hypothetical protein [Algoriphagus sp. A40]OOG78085.1 hypothetical protein B0E43_02950 [Algoriphagus sp. A40]
MKVTTDFHSSISASHIFERNQKNNYQYLKHDLNNKTKHTSVSVLKIQLFGEKSRKSGLSY